MNLESLPDELLKYYTNIAENRFKGELAELDENSDIYEFIHKIYILAFLNGVLTTYRVFWQNVRDNRNQ